MPKFSLSGLKNPGTRARLTIWAGAAVLGLAAVVIVALGATSGYWFCANGCHKVQDDTITAYNHSSHSKISCMACHMPVNANPVIFVLHKAEALGELYMTVTNNYELPLNRYDAVALEMSDKQCKQCHDLSKRDVTPSIGVLINHKAHADKGIACTVCHNRVAHKEDFEPTLKDPKTGEPNKKHVNFMTMDGCFRCHTQEDQAKVVGAANVEGEEKLTAPGSCDTCHPKGFDLKPAFHKTSSFFPAGHAEAASETLTQVAEGTKQAEEMKAEIKQASNKPEPVGMTIPTVGEVNNCNTCHKQSFCTDCHGTPMPHSDAFKEPASSDDASGHPVAAKAIPKKCVMCHGNNDKTHFCDECHHGKKIGYDYKPATQWVKQHPAAVADKGMDGCFKQCHEKKFCQDCHTKTKAVPSSHRSGQWVHAGRTQTIYGKSAAKPSARHAQAALKNIQSCEICHGAGGPNAAFCKNCHKTEMPHPDEFKKFHSKTGRANPAMCQNCHKLNQLCSDCHHVGASKSVPWIQQHGKAAVQNGVGTCTEKCHTKKDCLSCHQSRKPVPSSHRQANFVRNPSSNKAVHTQLYNKNPELCTYCHGNGGTDAAFCKSCHKLAMPHQIDSGNPQKFAHKDNFEKGKYSKATCMNCHNQQFCDSCHHQGSVASQPWLRRHPTIVKKSGPDKCFECHKEIYCSNCHVNLAKRGLIN